MTPKYCLYLNNGLNFHYSGLTFCNKLWIGDTYQKYEDDYLKTFFDNREHILQDMQNGIVPEHCKNCLYLKDYTNEEITPKIKFMEIYHWNECNCACFYCSNRHVTKLKMTQKRNIKGVIDVLPNLKKLQKQNLLDENLEVTMVGGEPTLLKEFSGILKFFIKHKYGINILSNGIYYEKYIPKAVKASEKSFLTISLDSGSPEVFKQIKGVDKFNDVLKNIKRYVKDAKDAKNRIMIKYIILEGVNDSKTEIDKCGIYEKNGEIELIIPHIINLETANMNKDIISSAYNLYKKDLVKKINKY